MTVGLPGSGKTTVARELEVSRHALRLTPDEWMQPLFGDGEAGGKRDVLEGRLIALGLVPLLAMLLVLGAATSWAASNIATRLARPADGFRLVVWASLVPPLPLAALSLLLEGPGAARTALAGLSWAGVAALAYLVVLATLVGFGIWTTLLRHYPASSVAPVSLLVPVVGLVAPGCCSASARAPAN